MSVSAKKENYFSKENVKRSLFHFLFGRAITSVISFVVAILIVRELSIPEYASYTALVGLLLILMMISGLGLERTVPKYLSEFKQKNKHIFLNKLVWILFKLRLLSLIIVLAFSYLFSDYIYSTFNIANTEKLTLVFLSYALLFGISMHLIRTLQALLLQRVVAKGMVIEWLIKLVLFVGVITFNNGLSLMQVFYLQLFPMLIANLYYIYSMRKFLMRLELTSGNFARVTPRKMLAFSLQNYVQLLSGFHALPSTGRLIAASFLTQGSVAAIGFAYALSDAFKRYLPANLFLGLIEPVVMAKYSENKSFGQVSLLTGTILKLNLFLIIPIMLWLAMNGKPIVDFISKDKYGDSVWLISAMFFILVLDSHKAMLQLICNAVDKSSVLITSNIVSYISMVLWIYLVLNFHDIGFVVGLAIVFVSRNLYIEFSLAKAGFQFKNDWFAILKIIVVSLIASEMAKYIMDTIDTNVLLETLISLVGAAIVYLVLLFLVKPFKPCERDALNGFVGKKIFIW